MDLDQEKYGELVFYTLAHKDPSFIHQNIVDAYATQHADKSTKPIKIIFALVGLYLCVEKKFTGRQVQLAHIQLSKEKKPWPVICYPESKGDITVSDVLSVQAGPQRDEMIKKWCAAVWDAWKGNKVKIVLFLRDAKIDF